MFEELNAQWNALNARVTELENKVAALSQSGSPSVSSGVFGPGSVPAAQPQAAVPPGMQPSAPPAPQAPATVPGMPASVAPGPQEVPSLDQLRERLMQLSQAQGDQACINVLIEHKGRDEAGNINIRLVPADNYAAMYADIGNRLGLH